MRTRTWPVAALTVALVVALPAVASADPIPLRWNYVKVAMKAHELSAANAFNSTFDKNGDRVLGTAVAGVSRAGDQLMATIPIPHCPEGGTLRRFEVRVKRYSGGLFSVEKTAWVSTVQVPLATAAELQEAGACGAANTGGPVGSGLEVTVQLNCPEGGGAYQSTIPVNITCDRNYKSPSTVPYGWRHTCPTDFVVKGTGKQVYDAGTPTVMCIRKDLDRVEPILSVKPALATQPGGLCSTLTRVETQQQTPTETMTIDGIKLQTP